MVLGRVIPTAQEGGLGLEPSWGSGMPFGKPQFYLLLLQNVALC